MWNSGHDFFISSMHHHRSIYQPCRISWPCYHHICPSKRASLWARAPCPVLAHFFPAGRMVISHVFPAAFCCIQKWRKSTWYTNDQHFPVNLTKSHAIFMRMRIVRVVRLMYCHGLWAVFLTSLSDALAISSLALVKWLWSEWETMQYGFIVEWYACAMSLEQLRTLY